MNPTLLKRGVDLPSMGIFFAFEKFQVLIVGQLKV